MKNYNNDSNMLVMVIVIIGLVASAFADCAWNEHVYGDWTCAWSKCIRVKP
jgi:hypothetical protein